MHFGGVLLSSEPARSACMSIAGAARSRGKLVSFDPNARPTLFSSTASLQALLREGCAASHLVKLSEEDLDALGMRPAHAPQLLGETTRALILSRGARGCSWWCDGQHGAVAAPEVTALDTTGAGDAMMAAVLWCLGNAGMRLSPETIARAARAGCAAGAVAVQTVGAIPSLPTQAELEQMLSRVP
jgi:fructokinase